MITPTILNLINNIAKNETMNSILTDDTSFAGVDNYSNEHEIDNEYETEDDIDSNIINELLHEPSEFHTPHQNNIRSSNKVEPGTENPETHDKTEETNTFEYGDDDSLDNSFNSISGINDLDLPKIDIHSDSMDGITNDNEDMIYKENTKHTTEYNADSNEVLQSNTDNITNETLNNTKRDVRTRQPNRNYRDFYQYYGQNEEQNQHNYEPEEAHVLMNIIQQYKDKAEDQKGICNT